MIKIFISDLHLEERHLESAELFFALLQAAITARIDSLFILGDLFEAWIGDDDLSAFNVSVMKHLRQASDQGMSIYLMHGNRDFLIGKSFLKNSGCKLLPDEQVIDLFGTQTLLMHGDTLCTHDKKYLKFRKKSRHWFFQTLFLLKSLRKRHIIAKRYRQASSQYTRTAPAHIMDVTQDEVRRVMQKHKVQHLIHGHTHRPFLHHLQLHTLPATRTVLGPWHNTGSILIYKENAEPILSEFTKDSLKNLFA